MINNLIKDLAKVPNEPSINFMIGIEYQKLGQFATAVSFFLKAAEYGYDSYTEIVYSSLIRIANCFDALGGRHHTVLNSLLQAVSYKPDRPEAYFLLARWYERNNKWAECYATACTGLLFANASGSIDLGYPGQQGLLFEKAVSGWWVGRQDESKKLFVELLRGHMLDETHRMAIFNNLERLGVKINDGVHPLEPVVTNYRKYFGADAHIIIDLGTRDGDDAEWLSHRLNGGRVIAVDANEDAVKATKEKYPWMETLYGAVADYSGTTTFQKVNSDNKDLAGCSSIYADKVTNNKEFFGLVELITVPVYRMDELLKNLGLTSEIIDLVKIDVEGYSWQVLEGFGEKLRNVKMLHIETETQATHANHRNCEDIINFMEEHGFVLVDTSYEWGSGIEDQIWVNPKHAYKNHQAL